MITVNGVKGLKDTQKGFYKIFGTSLCLNTGTGIGMTLFPMYAVLQFNASTATIGFLVSAGALACVPILIPSGMLSDRFGRKPLIILGSIFSFLGTVLLFSASSIELLLVSQIVLGISFSLFASPAQALVADLETPTNMARMVALYTLAPSLGMFLGPFIASLMLLYMPIRYTYLWSLPIILPSLILPFSIKSARSTSKMPSRASLGGFRKTLKNKSVVITSLVVAFFFFTVAALQTFYSIYALGQYGVDPATVAAVFSLRNLALIIARFLPVTNLAPKIGNKRLLIMGLLVSTSIALLPLAQNLEQSAIFIVLNGIGHGIIYTTGAMIITESTSLWERGTANAIYFLGLSVDNILSPVLMGFAAEAWGITIIFPILAMAPIIGLIVAKYMS